MYDQDFYEWTLEQSANLRRSRPDEVDWSNIAEELESLGKRDFRELRSRFIVLAMHILKWNYQVEMRSRSWRTTIDIQRIELAAILDDSPSLRTRLKQEWEMWFDIGRRNAINETGIKTIPKESPYSLDYILSGNLEL